MYLKEKHASSGWRDGSAVKKCIAFLKDPSSVHLLFGYRFLLIKETEKTGICMKTCGLSCPMRAFVTG